jgi:hypothetical protein
MKKNTTLRRLAHHNNTNTQNWKTAIWSLKDKCSFKCMIFIIKVTKCELIFQAIRNRFGFHYQTAKTRRYAQSDCIIQKRATQKQICEYFINLKSAYCVPSSCECEDGNCSVCRNVGTWTFNTWFLSSMYGTTIFERLLRYDKRLWNWSVECTFLSC